ncbi:hypothetical protein NDU88_001419, partial [Pleurodeles waltl]
PRPSSVGITSSFVLLACDRGYFEISFSFLEERAAPSGFTEVRLDPKVHILALRHFYIPLRCVLCFHPVQVLHSSHPRK